MIQAHIFQLAYLLSIFFMLISYSGYADLLLSSTQPLNASFSALLPPFITWKNREETINLPFSIGSTSNLPIEIFTQVSARCPQSTNNPHATCMLNTSDHSAGISYTIRYIPCGSVKSFYLSNQDTTTTRVTLTPKYTVWAQCQSEPGLISLTRLSLFEKPLPPSGLYNAQISLELREM